MAWIFGEKETVDSKLEIRMITYNTSKSSISNQNQFYHQFLIFKIQRGVETENF